MLTPASGPYDFEPTTTAALVAVLAAKADDGKFSITNAPTSLRFSGYAPKWGDQNWPAPLTFPVHLAAPLRPKNPSSAFLYSWRAVYRQRRQGGQLVADEAQSSIAIGLLAQQALDWMNQVDVRYPPLPTPNPVADVAGFPLSQIPKTGLRWPWGVSQP